MHVGPPGMVEKMEPISQLGQKQMADVKESIQLAGVRESAKKLPRACGQESENRNSQYLKKRVIAQNQIPKEYQDLAKIFGKRESDTLPSQSHRLCD